MGAVGGYSLDVYCDYDADGEGCASESQFTGRTEAECIRTARDFGWVVRKTGYVTAAGSGSVRCPSHKGKRTPRSS